MLSLTGCKLIAAIVATVNLVASFPANASDSVVDAARAAPANTSATKAANRQLAKSVRSRLFKQRGLTSTDITVFARGQAVVLIGTVVDQRQIELAKNVAEGTPGVSSVENRLTVQEQGH